MSAASTQPLGSPSNPTAANDTARDSNRQPAPGHAVFTATDPAEISATLDGEHDATRFLAVVRVSSNDGDELLRLVDRLAQVHPARRRAAFRRLQRVLERGLQA